MICPHCHGSAKYKYRRDRRCPNCGREFVFEPRQNALRMTDLRFRALTDRASDAGKLFYTPEQLMLYARRKGRGNGKTNKWDIFGYAVAVAAILVLVFAGAGGLATGGVAGVDAAIRKIIENAGEAAGALTLFIVLAVIFSVVNVGKLVLRQLGLYRDDVRLSPFQEADILNGAYVRWKDVHGSPPPGLLNRENRTDNWSEPPPNFYAVLVSTDYPVLRCLHANGIPEHLGLALLPASPAFFTKAEQTTIEVLRHDQSIPVLLLHDASHEGCLLVDTVHEALGLRSEHRLLDIGLRPRDVVKRHLPTFNDRLQPEALQRLRELAAAEEQAGAAPRVRLDAAELKWLEDGNYSPVRALTPKQLIAMVTHAVERATRAAPQRHEKARAERQAHAIGFLTWPEA